MIDLNNNSEKNKNNGIFKTDWFTDLFKPKKKYLYILLGLITGFIIFFPYEFGKLLDLWRDNFLNGLD